jgi:MinD-like ATPase involved in chromosome partitioning or flagellar assembly
MGRVIGVVSFKGGVGKTISAINIGAALVNHGKRVLIIDGNFLSPTLHVYLGLLNPEISLREVLRNNLLSEEAIYEHECGLHIMPCNFYKDIDFEGFKELVEELKGKYDFVIVDSGPSYTDEIVAVMMVATEVIFVTTPDYPTLVTTIRSAELAKGKNLQVTGVLVNKDKRRRFDLTKKDIEDTSGLKVIAEIREDNKIPKGFSKFMPVTHYAPWNKNSRRYFELAKFIIQNNIKEEQEILKLMKELEDFEK